MLNIIIKTLPATDIRAEQSGDWWLGDNERISVAVMADTYSPESELAIGIHELIEAFKCRKAGTNEDAIVKFDELFEQERKEGKHGPDAEPGDDPRAPYRAEHQDATHVERAVCLALGISWIGHEQAVAGSAANHQRNAARTPGPS